MPRGQYERKPRVKPAEIVHFDSGQVTNDGGEILDQRLPYTVRFILEGQAPLLFHRWSVDGVEEKAKAAKGSRAKKSDDIESYLWRDQKGDICLPGEYVRQSIIGAARFKQDPRSPRKSAADLFRAAIISLTPLASLGVKEPDYLDRRRVMVQRNGITRTRPAMVEGWDAEFQFLCNLSEYVSPLLLRQVLDDAGRLIGVGDFRPTFGRYTIRNWSVDEPNE